MGRRSLKGARGLSIAGVALLSSCGPGSVGEVGAGTAVDGELGTLSIALTDSGDLAGFRIDVADLTGEVVASRFAAPDIRTFFRLAPGNYVVSSTPMRSETETEAACSVDREDVIVREEQTTSVTLFSRCAAAAGDLDVTVGANAAPELRVVEVSPGEGVAPCDPVSIAFEARDRDDDVMRCELQVAADAPLALATQPGQEPGAVRCEARLEPASGGDRTITVRACDAGGCDALAFTLAVAPGSCTPRCEDGRRDTLDEVGPSDLCINHALPPAPAGLGAEAAAEAPDPVTTPPFVDFATTNQRGDARYATLETNAGVRVLARFLDLWRPSSLLVDAGVTAAARDGFPAITPATWTGIPGDASDGTKLNAAVLDENIQYVVDVTAQRTPAQELAAYLDDRRQKGYSVSDGLGPLTDAWRTAAQQFTTITSIPADATRVRYDDGGNDNGVGGSANPLFGTVVDFVSGSGENGSTEPAKRYFKYARPWRWTSAVKVVPALEPAKSQTPATDGGFNSGHAAEAVRKALAIAYVVPERFQEMVCRGLELGENRVLSGMHSPLDVMGGRVQAMAVVAASLTTGSNAARKTSAYEQAHAALMSAVGAPDAAAFLALAHAQDLDQDRFADPALNAVHCGHLLTYGFDAIGDTTRAASVPKGAEVLLETRLPYLTGAQRRVVLASTALPSGYPLLDDAEGWGRLDLFAAADGYGSLAGDVVVTMDATRGGFHARDTFRHDLHGAGKLTKRGSGTLALTGTNEFTGGVELQGGRLEARSSRALGAGGVYVAAGTLAVFVDGTLHVTGDYTHWDDTTLELTLSRRGAQAVQVDGAVALAGGTLRVRFAPEARPAVGAELALLSAASLRGRFDAIEVDGFDVEPSYTATGLTLRVQAAR